MSLTVEISSAAFRKVKKLNKLVKEELFEQAKKLSKDPEAGGRLKGKYKKLRSLRFVYKKVSYRVIYFFDKKKRKVLIAWAGTRENLYRELDRLKLRI